MKKGAGRRPEAEAEVTRQRILASARFLFAQRGFDAIGLREIADAAGTTHGLVRHHFGTKMGIWQTVVDAADREFSDALGPALDWNAKEETRAAATRFIRRFIEVAAQNADLTRLLMHEGTAEGPRLTYLLRYVSTAHQRLRPMVAKLHGCGLLTQFSSKTLFHFLLFSTAAPFAMPSLSAGLLGEDLSARRHAERITKTLLG